MRESAARSDEGSAILGSPEEGGIFMRMIVLVALSLLIGASPLGAADAPTKPAPVAAPELARFNDLLAGLAESLKPAIVHVRVRRSGPVKDDQEGEPRAAA